MSEEKLAVVDSTATEVLPPPKVAAAIVPTGPASVSLTDLTALGFIVPIATPQTLRAAFAERQQLMASILDENDYLYAVSYMEKGRMRQNMYTRRADAEKAAQAYGTDVRATPKKSGIVKLAAALGIEAKRKQISGLPVDPGAAYSYVLYEATHKGTGRSEEGVGWCDRTERGGNISAHDVIATADTRAYNRAILRLAGFGEVSGDEIVSVMTDESHFDPAPKKPAPLPPLSHDDVVIAMRAWAEESAKRGEMLPDAQQGSKLARELRARARRGGELAARQMGQSGFRWSGSAQDSATHEAFDVEEPTITVADIERVRAAAAAAAKPAEKPAEKKPEGTGWDLSGTGSTTEENRKPDELPPVSRPQAAASVPAAGTFVTGRDGSQETITLIQQKALSELLLGKLGTREAAQQWLRETAGVDRGALVRQSQFEAIKTALANMPARNTTTTVQKES